MVSVDESDAYIPEELLDEAQRRLFPDPPHRKTEEDKEATQPAVQDDDDKSADETTEEDDNKEVAPVVEPIKSVKQRIGSAFPCLDRFIRTGDFRRPAADTPQGLREAKGLVEKMLSTGKMHPELLKMWRSRDVQAESREEALHYDRETKSRNEVYNVS